MIDKIKQFLFSGSEDMDLQDFIDLASIGETNLVERKSIRLFDDLNGNKDKIKEKLSQAMSAFGNYTGGFLLWGVDDNSGNIEEGVDNNFGSTTIKEWLEDILWTCCSPSYKDYSVKKVLKDSKYLYAIVFGRSSLAPHQANYGQNKYRYFSRVDGKSKPIDGVLVRDIFNREENAELEIEPQLIANGGLNGELVLDLKLHNISNISAEKVVVIMTLSQQVINGSRGGPHVNLSQDKGQFNTEIVYPKLPKDIVGREKIKLNEFDEVNCQFLIVAKNMPLKEVNFKFKKEANRYLVQRFYIARS
ncbi:hypothetical protein GF366_01040 [Candidatus Peregrinibacteria bacterium]|nr:hypothetical protein [Candidatus Peregrinibacteria bacterium]